MAAGTWNITIEQGARWSRTLTWKDAAGALVNLTGYTARMQIRQRRDDTATLIELTTTNGRIVLGGAAGTITLTLTAVETATLTVNGVYDLEMVPASGENDVVRLVSGTVTLSQEVTR